MTPREPGPVRDGPPADDGAELRQRAERQLEQDEGASSGDRAPPSIEEAEEAREVVHELKVHQIELELQNEELRRIQAELETSRERYFVLYDLAPVAYLTLSETGLILEANLTAARLLEAPRAALVGQPFTRFIAPDSQDTYYLHRRKLFEKGVPQTLELEMRRAGGASFAAGLMSTLATGDAGARVSRTVVTDISVRKREEDERRKLEQRVQQAERADSLGRMAGAISHHFNNVLGVTIANLELLSGDLAGTAGQDERVADALAAARSAARVSGMLLTYLGQTRGEDGPQDLAEICRQALPVLRGALPDGTELEAEISSPGPSVHVSAGQIHQVLGNLVTNAWEAVGPKGGTIRLAVHSVPGDDLPNAPIANRFPARWDPREERYACLSVTDSGAGIEPSAVGRIFDPFFSSKEFGRGLGLSVALGVVKAHGGAIAVKSDSAGGTTMEVYLPVVAAAQKGAGAEAPSRAAVMKGTVLLVDDEPMLRSVGTRILTRLGFDVLTAEDGVAALEVFDEHRERIVCVLCDLTMPRMNGWDTMRALRERRPELPIILTSGFEETPEVPGDERPQAFLGKPWDLAKLEEALTHALASTRSAPQRRGTRT